MKNTIFLIVISALLSLAPFGAASEESGDTKGAKEMVLQGGAKGNIQFPHEKHQTALGDCGKCHSIFSQTPGSIQKLIGEGKLEKKAVMNHCRDCHREMEAAGKKTGPTSCAKCHDKALK